MLTRILHNSDRLCTFLDQLGVELSRPQRRHILNMADALLVCEDKKTLAALQRQFVEAPDASNMADFLRISPWQAGTVGATLQPATSRTTNTATSAHRPPLPGRRYPSGWEGWGVGTLSSYNGGGSLSRAPGGASTAPSSSGSLVAAIQRCSRPRISYRTPAIAGSVARLSVSLGSKTRSYSCSSAGCRWRQSCACHSSLLGLPSQFISPGRGPS